MENLSEEDIQIFLKFEKEFELNKLRYKNQKVWPIIRWAVYDAILSHQNKAQVAVSSTKIGTNKSFLKKLVKLFISLLSFYNLPGKTDILLFNYGRVLDFKTKKDNLLVWSFMEPLQDDYDITVVDQYNIYPVGSKSVLNICEILSMTSYISQKFKYLSKWGLLENELNKMILGFYGFKVDLKHIYKNNFIYQRYMGLLSKLIFLIKKPKIIIYSDTGSFSEVIRRAKTKHIITIDYQHALQSGQNLLYSHSSTILDQYSEFLSDYIMTFGKYWNKYFDSNYNVIPVGSSYQDLMIDEVQNNPQDDKSIIFISDGEMARKEFEKVAIEISKKRSDLKIFYRLRPDEFDIWKTLYSKEIQAVDNIIFLDSNEPSLHYYLRKCKYVIGINSTVLVEAMPLSNVIVHKKGWYIEMNQFIEDEFVLTSSNAEDILNIIQHDKLPKKMINKENLFKGNSQKNIKDSISEILKKDNLANQS